MAVNPIHDPRRATRRFFIFVAVLFPLLVLIGFARTYYLRAFLDGPPVPAARRHGCGLQHG